jgi:hypothetical protein
MLCFPNGSPRSIISKAREAQHAGAKVVGYYDWESVPSQVLALSHAPVQAQLAASITIPDLPFGAAYETSVETKTGLPQLSIVEWSVCWEVASLFALLRAAGSRFGFVAGQGDEHQARTEVRRIELSEAIAQAIEADAVLELPMAFVDDQSLCSLVSFFSDYALIGLSPDLFAVWLKNRPIDLTMWGGEEPWPAANNLADAQRLARRRRAAWDDYIREGRRV